MSLSKIYKVKDVVNTIQLWLNDELKKQLDPGIIKRFSNIAVLEKAEEISLVTDDYGKTANLSDAASSSTTTIVTSAAYTDSSRNIEKTSHGLTAADIGKRIALWISTSRAGIAEIESITDADNFVITKALGADGTVNYALFSHHSGTNLDISDLKVMNIVKLHSSIHNEIKRVEPVEFENLSRSDFQKPSWYKHGETIFLFIPESKQAGDLTLYYNTYPEKKTSDTDYFDIRDIYIPYVIKRTKELCADYLQVNLKGEK